MNPLSMSCDNSGSEATSRCSRAPAPRDLGPEILLAIIKRTEGNIHAAARLLGWYDQRLNHALRDCGITRAQVVELRSQRRRSWRFSRESLLAIMEEAGGNVSKAARNVGCHRRQMQRCLKRCGITPVRAAGPRKKGGSEEEDGQGPVPTHTVDRVAS